MDTVIARRRVSLFVFFFIPGVALASWVTRMPGIRDSISASIAEMGMVLMGLSLGSIIGILASGSFVGRYGTRPVAHFGIGLVVLSMLVFALAAYVGSFWLVALGFFCFGLGMGSAEIAINVDGAVVETITGKPLLHALHGFFSFGTVIGALIGLGFTTLSVPVTWHLIVIGVLTFILMVSFAGAITSGTGLTKPQNAGIAKQSSPSLLKDGKLLLIGFITLAVALAEGAANDWLPILMVDEYGFDQASGSLIFLAFAAAMTVGRFSGSYFLARFDRTTIILTSASIGALGMGIVVFGEDPFLGGLAVVLWGLGASLCFPVALSAAGASGDDPASRIKLVAKAGYIALLVGPPMLGFVGESHGLRVALAIVLAFLVMAAFVAPLVKPKRRRV